MVTEGGGCIDHGEDLEQDYVISSVLIVHIYFSPCRQLGWQYQPPAARYACAIRTLLTTLYLTHFAIFIPP